MARWGSGSLGVSRVGGHWSERPSWSTEGRNREGGDRPCSWGMHCPQESPKNLPCLLTCPEDFGNFHASISLLPWRVSPWLPPHQEHRDVGKQHVCGGGSRVVSSQDSGLSPLSSVTTEGPVPVPLSTSHKNEIPGDFPSGPVAKTLCSQGRGPRFDSWGT